MFIISKVNINILFFFLYVFVSIISLSKIVEKKTNPLVYLVSCLTATIRNGQVLKIRNLLVSDIPKHLIDTIVVINLKVFYLHKFERSEIRMK